PEFSSAQLRQLRGLAHREDFVEICAVDDQLDGLGLGGRGNGGGGRIGEDILNDRRGGIAMEGLGIEFEKHLGPARSMSENTPQSDQYPFLKYFASTTSTASQAADEMIIIKDEHGICIIYEAALAFLTHIEHELLQIASYFINVMIDSKMEEIIARIAQHNASLSLGSNKTNPQNIGKLSNLMQSNMQVLPSSVKEELRKDIASRFDFQQLLLEVLDCELVFQRAKRRLIGLYKE
ncbi:MAG: hypothetical protein EZS28_054283, partial [Streblomastix strix]